MNLGGIYKSLGKISDAISSSLKSIQLKPVDNLDACNNLVSILQQPKEKDSTAPANLIEAIDNKVRSMGEPTTGEGKIGVGDIDSFIKKALNIATPLEGILTTTLTQIYHRTKKTEPNCKSLAEFFESQNSIAQRCHNCYKVQIEVYSLDELIILNFLMKTLHLENDNTRKCMIELRKHAKGLYKGLIYCTEIDEAESVANETKLYISERSKINPIFTVKRGCTEFTNAHKEYGEIGYLGNLHKGTQQRKEWELNEKRFLEGKSDIIRADITGWEFNLGELLILKNWILYALAMEDEGAIAKYGNIHYDNKIISKAIDLKRGLAH